MRIRYMERTEALPVLKAVDPADLLLEVLARGVKVMPPENLMNKRTTCPHCGEEGQVAKDFGVRVLGGTVRPQSWCRECRKNPNRKEASKRTTTGQTFPKTKDELIALLRKALTPAQLKGLAAGQKAVLSSALRGARK